MNYSGLNEINKGVTAKDIALALSLDRANVSRYLNELYKENQLEKITGRPVLYQSIAVNENEQEEYSKMNAFSRLIGYEASLKEVVQQAKAAILYPPMDCIRLFLVKRVLGNHYLQNVCINMLWNQMHYLQMLLLLLIIVLIMLKTHNYYLGTFLV